MAGIPLKKLNEAFRRNFTEDKPTELGPMKMREAFKINLRTVIAHDEEIKHDEAEAALELTLRFITDAEIDLTQRAHDEKAAADLMVKLYNEAKQRTASWLVIVKLSDFLL